MSAIEFPTTELIRLWSVTSLQRVALGTSDGLVNWGERIVAARAVDRHATVAQMVADGDRDAAIKFVLDARWKAMNDGRDRGTAFHNAAEQLALGLEPTGVPPHVVPYVDQLRRWLDLFQPRFLLAEAPVYNVTYDYAGTTDGIMELDGLRLIFDYKTTEHGPNDGRMRPPFPENALQLCAYSRAEMVGVLAEQRYDNKKRYYLFDKTRPHEAMPAVDGALVIVVSPQDCIAVPTRIDDAIWSAWRRVMEVARWQLETSKGAFGPPLVKRDQEVAG